MKPYLTSDSGFAAYLWCKGYAPIKAIPGTYSDKRRKDFVFTDYPDNVDEMYKSFDNFEADTFSPKELVQKIKATQRLAHNSLTAEEMERMRRNG